ncbi:SapC family protein [Pelagerythrobacter marensis]|uniref:SapC superfamily n=1 Tax=Pelagerythrobacter marensis TaxID=543877 RepID=A0A0G3X6W5_9SPHN|nr:SapC family protein [Pelagerythrobacter marensis]AKM06376.1 SapC superfamily [Pelagerythrobacter marensis]
MTENSKLPLFYSDPAPLSSQRHASWRLKAGDMGFAAETACVPIVVGEIAAASRDYPIVFGGGDATPLAVVGLEQANLFVNDGEWDKHSYLPAYVRRYPFGFVKTAEPESYALAIDAGSERLTSKGKDGLALFEDGKPSEVTRQALAFCDSFRREAQATQEFAEALQSHDLLIDRRADATLPNGRQLGLGGFQVVDADKFAKLDTQVVAQWHASGWLALVHFHLASLDRFRSLLSRQTARGTAGNAAPGAEAAA